MRHENRLYRWGSSWPVLWLAHEATRALMRHAFSEYNLHRIVADIDTRNPESAAMAEKLGMRREGEFIDADFETNEAACGGSGHLE